MSEEEKDQVQEVAEETAAQEPEKASVEEAEKKTGIKEEASNEEAIAEKENKEEPSEPALPSFFVEEEDELKIEVDVLFDKDNGKLLSVSRSGLLDESQFEALGHSEEYFTFKPVGYDQMTRYRQQCSEYRRDAGRAIIDPVALRNYLIVWHLKDWSMRDRKGNKIELAFTETGCLDEKSIEAVYKVNTTMLDVVLTLFEKDMMM